MKFSPGPWSVLATTVVTGRDGEWICTACRADSAVAAADAILIAAAPELLAAAKFFAEFGGANQSEFKSDPVIMRHLNAIRKAEGEGV